MNHTETKTVVIRRSPQFAAGYIAPSAFLGILSFSLFAKGALFSGGLVALCALGGVIIGIYILNDQGTQITLEESFINIKGQPPIHWEKIQSVRLEFRPRGIKILTLELHEPIGEKIRLQVHGLDMKAGEIQAYISRKIGED